MLRRGMKRVRRQAGAVVVDSFFNGLSKLGRLHPGANPAKHGVEVIADVPYKPGGGAQHKLDVYRPTQRQGPRPVILYIHGGGFRILSKDSHWVMGLAFARQGYVVFNISYRLAPKHRFPAALQDAIDAYAFVLDHAEEYGGDLSSVVVAGESAGANLSAALTIATCHRRPEPWARTAFERGRVPDACLPACGIFQVSDTNRFARRKRPLSPFVQDRMSEVTAAYLGDVAAEPSDETALADPLLIVERGGPFERPLPPFFLPVGTRDPLKDDNRRMHAALQALGVQSEAKYYEGEVHAFHALVWRRNARRCWRDTYRFLDSVL